MNVAAFIVRWRIERRAKTNQKRVTSAQLTERRTRRRKRRRRTAVSSEEKTMPKQKEQLRLDDYVCVCLHGVAC